jgi:hypothetical protein
MVNFLVNVKNVKVLVLGIDHQHRLNLKISKTIKQDLSFGLRNVFFEPIKH